MTTTPQPPYVNTREETAFRFLGIPTIMRSTAETTNGAFGLIEHWAMPVGFASPYHTHHREDESFYVLEGDIGFICNGKWLKAGPGTFVYGPREVPHGFKVIGHSPARMLVMCTPGGFEGFVLEQTTPMTDPPSSPDMDKLMMLAAKYGIEIHGPLPPEPKSFEAEANPPADLKSLNHRWIQAFNDRDWQTERAVRGESFRAYLSGAAEPLDNDAWSRFMAAFTEGFPDSRIQSSPASRKGTRWSLAGHSPARTRGCFRGFRLRGGL